MATQETARQEAAHILRPHATDPAIADIIASLTGEGEGEDDALEKAMRQIGEARVQLAKDDRVSVADAYAVGQRLEKAERRLRAEYLSRHSAGFAKAEASKAEAERLRLRNLGRA